MYIACGYIIDNSKTYKRNIYGYMYFYHMDISHIRVTRWIISFSWCMYSKFVTPYILIYVRYRCYWLAMAPREDQYSFPWRCPELRTCYLYLHLHVSLYILLNHIFYSPLLNTYYLCILCDLYVYIYIYRHEYDSI